MKQIHAWGGVTEYFVKRDYSQLPENTRTNLDAWLENMDRSYLTNLELQTASPEILQKIGPVLISLSFFRIEYGNKGSLGDFFASTKRPLESISIRNAGSTDLSQYVSDIVMYHGSVLESFTFLGPQLDISYITEIREGCAHLETIDLNARRVHQPSDNDNYDTWTFNHPFLDTLISIASLKNLSIRATIRHEYKDST